MKILLATHYFGSHKGGVELVAEELFRRLATAGQEIVWVAGEVTALPEPVGKSHGVGLPVWNFVERKLGVPFPMPGLHALQRIRAAVKGADVIMLHDCLYLTNIAAYLLARVRGVPTIIVQHIGLVPYKNSALRVLMRTANNTLTKPMLSHAQQVVFISEATERFFSDVPFRRRPEVIFNGVDTEVFRMAESPEKKSDLRRKYELPLERHAVLFVGRFVEKKGLSILKDIVDKRPQLTWVFAGWGPMNPASWNKPNVRVFEGLRGTSVADLYRACDLLVLPSTGEGLPLVIQEALASGLPVVCGADTAASDSLMGRFVKGVSMVPEDTAGISDEFLSAIDVCLSSPMQSIASYKSRRAFAIERYSWDRAVACYLEIFSRLHPPAVSHSAAASRKMEKTVG